MTTDLPPEIDGKLQSALHYGGMLFNAVCPFGTLRTEEDFSDSLEEVLILLQQIGEIYSQKELN